MKFDILLLLIATLSAYGAVWAFWRLPVTQTTVKAILVLLTLCGATLLWWALR